ncbi:MAG TPA: ABC transporter substrate-binding protein [Thermodesulfobacteriota bacterium]|nr:ABC transporter substrate-binding protein [Thermodesulfobacteriota bacterium]
MKKNLFLIGVLFICLAMIGESGIAQAQSAEPIKIGFMGNLSAPSSISAKAAATMAIDEMNQAGGILGRQIKLIVEDTKGEIPKCVEIYKKLVMVDRVLAVFIGEKVEMGVAGMEIGAELYPEYPHIFFSTIGSGDDIWHHVRDNYKKYKFGFQTYYSISTNYLKIVSELNTEVFKKLIGTKKVAIVYEDMEWTKPLRKGLKDVSPRLAEVYKKNGLEVVYETTVSLDQKMFSSVFEEIAASGAGVVDCTVGYIDEAAFVKQWAQSSARNIPVSIWGGLAGMPPAWKMTEGKVAGVMVGSSMVKVPITKKTIPFMDNLMAQYKVGPIFGSHTTYDTLYGFKKAIEKAGGVNNIEALIKQLEQVEEVAVLGTIGWEPRYHYNLPYPKYITPTVQWQKGEMKVIFPLQFKQANYIPPDDLRR